MFFLLKTTGIKDTCFKSSTSRLEAKDFFTDKVKELAKENNKSKENDLAKETDLNNNVVLDETTEQSKKRDV